MKSIPDTYMVKMGEEELTVRIYRDIEDNEWVSISNNGVQIIVAHTDPEGENNQTPLYVGVVASRDKITVLLNDRVV